MIGPIIIQLATLLLVLVSGTSYGEKVTYSGYTLYRCLPQKSSQVDHLHSLMNEKNDGIEFWTEPSGLNHTVDIMASPEKEEYLRNKLRSLRIPTRKIMHDVGEVIRRTSPTYPRVTQTFRDGTNISSDLQRDFLNYRVFFSKFQAYSSIESKLKELAKDPRVTLEHVGLSYEKRQIYLVKVSTDLSAKKPVIFIDAGHHAREWISHSTILYLMESLINNDLTVKESTLNFIDNDNECNDELIDYKSQLYKSLQSHLDKYDFWFVPVVNPDGYVYTHTTNRLWRKTRSRNTNFCIGADPNRNYPFHWREAGASSFSCDDTYAGTKPLSEPEIEIMANILDKNSQRIRMYISLHSYSQLILAPYGYGRVYPNNYAEMKKVANAGMRAIASVRGTRYQFGPSAIILYPAAGGSDDYAHGHANIKLSYTIELPDSGDRGFLLPPSEIIPVGQETIAGLSAMIDAV